MAADATGVPRRQLKPAAIAALVAAQNLVFAGLGLLAWYWSGRPVHAMVELSDTALALGIVLGVVLVGIAWAFFRGFPRIGDRLVELQADTYRFLGRDLRWPTIIIIALAAGIGEEMLLRGGLQTLLGDYVGPLFAIVLASAIFAAIHLAKPVITALLFVIGIVFGTVYTLSGSLLAVMIAHALYDVWALRYLHGEFVRLGVFDLVEAPGLEVSPAAGQSRRPSLRRAPNHIFGVFDGFPLRDRRPAQCRQVDAVQCLDRNAGRTGRELSLLHDRTERRPGGGARRTAGPDRADCQVGQDHPHSARIRRYRRASERCEPR